MTPGESGGRGGPVDNVTGRVVVGAQRTGPPPGGDARPTMPLRSIVGFPDRRYLLRVMIDFVAGREAGPGSIMSIRSRLRMQFPGDDGGLQRNWG
jgi:hypothetical protein